MKAITRILSVLSLTTLCVACGGSGNNTVTDQPFGAEASLSSLSISVGTLDPAFNQSVTSYTATVPNGTDSVVVSATKIDKNDTLTINGSNNATVALVVGDNTISIKVLSEDALTGRNYTIVVTRLSVAQEAFDRLSNIEANNLFGLSTALSGDGSTLAVGAIDEDGAATGVNGDQADNSAVGAGAVYVFTRDSGGVWTQQAYVKASNTEANDLFGLSTALSSDGNTLAVGAIDEDSAATGVNGDQADNSAARAGAVYVFTRDSGGVWAQQAYVKASNTDANDLFGWNVALSDDGNGLAVSVFDERSAGAVYVFTRDSGGVWAPQAFP